MPPVRARGQPRAWVYLENLSGNPDITDYSGYADRQGIVGWKCGLQLSVPGRMGKNANHSSLQLDPMYPMMKILVIPACA